MRKWKVERTISDGRRKSNASLFGVAPGWVGTSTTMLVAGGDCDKAASVMDPLTRIDERGEGCGWTRDEPAQGTYPPIPFEFLSGLPS